MKIWILTNETGHFIEACETRETAILEMRKWRGNFVKCGLFQEVEEVDTSYYSRITFRVTDRRGKIREMAAREVAVI